VFKLIRRIVSYTSSLVRVYSLIIYYYLVVVVFGWFDLTDDESFLFMVLKKRGVIYIYMDISVFYYVSFVFPCLLYDSLDYLL